MLEHKDGTGPTGKILNPGAANPEFRLGARVTDGSRVLTKTTEFRRLPDIDMSDQEGAELDFQPANGAWVGQRRAVQP